MVSTYFAWFFKINEEIEVTIVADNEIEARLKIKEKFDECNSIKLTRVIENFFPYQDENYKERYLEIMKEMVNKMGEMKNKDEEKKNIGNISSPCITSINGGSA